MRLLLSVLAASAVAAPAFAALHPKYYEEARRNAKEVVVFRVDKVTGKRPADGYGECLVSGRVQTVERGSHYRVGGPVRVAVPCVWPDAEVRVGGVIYQTPGELKRSKLARAWMDAPGKLALYQYETLR